MSVRRQMLSSCLKDEKLRTDVGSYELPSSQEAGSRHAVHDADNYTNQADWKCFIRNRNGVNT